MIVVFEEQLHVWTVEGFAEQPVLCFLQR